MVISWQDHTDGIVTQRVRRRKVEIFFENLVLVVFCWQCQPCLELRTALRFVIFSRKIQRCATTAGGSGTISFFGSLSSLLSEFSESEKVFCRADLKRKSETNPKFLINSLARVHDYILRTAYGNSMSRYSSIAWTFLFLIDYDIRIQDISTECVSEISWRKHFLFLTVNWYLFFSAYLHV